MAAHVLALYNAPLDPTAFEQYYHGTHVPLAKRLPGLRSYLVNKGALAFGGGSAPLYLVAVLAFDSMGSIAAALESPEGKATVADLANFATGGVTVAMYETEEL
ncbi:MAG: EthD family reductase [Candidatus Velthaea sp.]